MLGLDAGKEGGRKEGRKEGREGEVRVRLVNVNPPILEKPFPVGLIA